jgi:hypothetical protein
MLTGACLQQVLHKLPLFRSQKRVGLGVQEARGIRRSGTACGVEMPTLLAVFALRQKLCCEPMSDVFIHRLRPGVVCYGKGRLSSALKSQVAPFAHYYAPTSYTRGKCKGMQMQCNILYWGFRSTRTARAQRAACGVAARRAPSQHFACRA